MNDAAAQRGSGAMGLGLAALALCASQFLQCSQVLGLDEAEQRSAAGGSGAGAAGAGGSAGNGGAGGSAAGTAGAGGSTDTCAWEPLEDPWKKLEMNGSFEDWVGELPVGWSSVDRHFPDGAYELAPGCAGENALRLTDVTTPGMIGVQHGSRAKFAAPSDATVSCWQMRGYFRLVSGSFVSAGALFWAQQPWESIGFEPTSAWQPKIARYQVDEAIVDPFLSLYVGANDLGAVTAVDFDNLELWYHDGPCS